jgi:hypothetical protein
MAKKILKKKKAPKVMIADTPKAVGGFKLDGSDDARIMSSLISLQATEGWALIVQMTNENIKIIEEQIITKRNVFGGALSDTDVDILRQRYAIYKEIIELPSRLIQQTKREDGKQENDDPYWNMDEMKKAERTLKT